MQEFDAYYSNSMALGGGIDYFPGLPTPLWHPPPTDDYHGFPAYLPEEDEQLLADLHGFLSDPNLLLDTANLYTDPPPPPPPPLHSTSTKFLAPADNYLFHEQFAPPFQLHYYDDQNYYLMDDLQPPPKRKKCFPSPPTFTDFSVPDFFAPPPPPTYILPPPPPPPPPVQVQSCSCTLHSNNNSHKRKESGGAPATPQSIAARDRRKKISNKTMELGKLVPGAESGKMNTAEMLQHAFKYVKFMQSQISLLQLIDQEEEIKNENLQIVASSAVQEKLYMKDKCLVTLDLIQQLAADGDLQSQGSISADLKQLMQSVSARSG